MHQQPGGLWLVVGGWRLNFWIMAAFGLAVGAAAFLTMRETLSDEAKDHARSENAVLAYAALLGQRRIMGYMLAGAEGNGGEPREWVQGVLPKSRRAS